MEVTINLNVTGLKPATSTALSDNLTLDDFLYHLTGTQNALIDELASWGEMLVGLQGKGARLREEDLPGTRSMPRKQQGMPLEELLAVLEQLGIFARVTGVEHRKAQRIDSLAVGIVKPTPTFPQFEHAADQIGLVVPYGRDGVSMAFIGVEQAKQLVNRIGEMISVAEGRSTHQDGPGTAD